MNPHEIVGTPFYLKEWTESVLKHVKGIKTKVGWHFVRQEISLKGSLGQVQECSDCGSPRAVERVRPKALSLMG